MLEDEITLEQILKMIESVYYADDNYEEIYEKLKEHYIPKLFDEIRSLKTNNECLLNLMEHDNNLFVPKKPKFDKLWEEFGYKDIYYECGVINPNRCVCPNCGKHSIYDSEYRGKLKYCYECGQAIDWSGKNDS